MAVSATGRRRPRWSRPTLLAGGVVVLGFAGLFAVDALTTTTTEKGLASGGGYTLVFVGLLGLYPTLVDETPRLATIGAGCAALGAIGFGGIFLTTVAQLLGLLPTPDPAWVAYFTLPAIVGMIPGFLSIAIAATRTERYTTTMSGLLVVPAVLFTLNIAVIATLGTQSPSPWWGFLITLGEAGAILGFGYRLSTVDHPNDTQQPTEASG